MARRAKYEWLLCGAVLIMMVLAFVRIHVRVQTTFIGYQIGSLKNSETKLLDQRSRLKIQLAQITTQEHLSELARESASKK